MKNASILVALCLVGFAAAFPLVEDENGNYMELIPLSRVARRAPPMRIREIRERDQYEGDESRPAIVVLPRGEPMEDRYEPIAAASGKEPIAAETGYGHSHHPYDYVDYGAYTGGYGAFGWYTDHPVYTSGHGGY